MSVTRTGAVPGQEFSATVQVPASRVSSTNGITVEGVLFLPQQVALARAVIAIVDWGLGPALYADAAWRALAAQQAVRNAAIGGGAGVLLLLQRLGAQSGHPELQSAKLLLWGYSAAGSFALTFAALHPQCTIGFVRYHSHLRDLAVDIAPVAHIPGLLLAGEADEIAGVTDTEALWQRGRALGAPWAFGIEEDNLQNCPT